MQILTLIFNISKLDERLSVGGKRDIVKGF